LTIIQPTLLVENSLVAGKQKGKKPQLSRKHKFLLTTEEDPCNSPLQHNTICTGRTKKQAPGEKVNLLFSKEFDVPEEMAEREETRKL